MGRMAVTGESAVRRTVFDNSVMAIQDLTVAAAVLDGARREGLIEYIEF